MRKDKVEMINLAVKCINLKLSDKKQPGYALTLMKKLTSLKVLLVGMMTKAKLTLTIVIRSDKIPLESLTIFIRTITSVI